MNTEKVMVRANNLEKRLDVLNDVFNTTEKTIIEVEQTGVVIDEQQDELAQIKEDFAIVRKTLLNTIAKANDMLECLSPGIQIEPTAEMVTAYATLLNTINTSAQLLSNVHRNVVELKQKIVPKVENTEVKQATLTVAEITRMISKTSKES